MLFSSNSKIHVHVVSEIFLNTCLSLPLYRPNVELLLPAAFPNKTYTLDLTEGKGEKKSGNISHSVHVHCHYFLYCPDCSYLAPGRGWDLTLP